MSDFYFSMAQEKRIKEMISEFIFGGEMYARMTHSQKGNNVVAKLPVGAVVKIDGIPFECLESPTLKGTEGNFEIAGLSKYVLR